MLNQGGYPKGHYRKKEIATDSIVLFDAIVLLGKAGINQTEKPLRLVGYEFDKVKSGSLRVDTTFQLSKSPLPTSFVGISKISSPGGKDT